MTPDDADTAGTGIDPLAPDPARVSVRLAGYSVELGAPTGLVISEVAEASGGAAPALSDALREGPRERVREGAQVFSEAVGEASEVTSKTERAVTLFRAVAEGRALDPDQLSGEVDALLDLLERLDKEGRCKEALALARSLSGLLALLMRWSELVRSLRLALTAAETIGDWPGVALVKHQIGTLELVAGDTSAAERSLGEARDIRQRLGDRRALAATERNLQFLCRRLRHQLRQGELTPRSARFRRSRVLLALAAAALLLTGGAAGAVVDGGAGASVDLTDPPGGLSVKIRAPVENASFRTGATVLADYSCTDGDHRADSCKGPVEDGQRIDTSRGRHTFTVTATADDGRQAAESVSYSVSDSAPVDRTDPTIRITSPRSGTLPADARPRAEYTCADEPGGSGIRSCTATDENGRRVTDGQPVNASPGRHTLTVTAVDAKGNVARKPVSYLIERGGGPTPECADHVDNDGDHKVDKDDPGCAADDTEADPPRTSECADGVDNDGDGEVDQHDQGCVDGDTEAGEPPRRTTTDTPAVPLSPPR